jgi:hypothetical protein
MWKKWKMHEGGKQNDEKKPIAGKKVPTAP